MADHKCALPDKLLKCRIQERLWYRAGVRMKCSNKECKSAKYIHKDCFDELEDRLVKRIQKGQSTGRDWSYSQLKQGLWGPKLYNKIRMWVECPLCDGSKKGYLCKSDDSDPTPPPTPPKQQRKGSKKGKNNKNLPVLEDAKRPPVERRGKGAQFIPPEARPVGPKPDSH